jgi:Sulfotransferase domain
MSASDVLLPDFIAVGPPRTATTWLERVLEGHVGLPAGIKETDFFGKHYGLGLEWYAAHFRGCDRSRPVGEICPVYFDSPEARARIAVHIPRCRIICTMRDPVERLYSHYRLLRREGWIGAITLEAALAKDLDWSGPGNLHGSNRYAAHVRGWRETFGPENVLVLLHDDLVADPNDYLALVCAFIGIDSFTLPEVRARERVNTVERAPSSPRTAQRARKLREWLIRRRMYKILYACQPLWDFCSGHGEPFAPLDPELEARLRARLRQEIHALEVLLQRDLSNWKEKPRRAA